MLVWSIDNVDDHILILYHGLYRLGLLLHYTLSNKTWVQSNSYLKLLFAHNIVCDFIFVLIKLILGQGQNAMLLVIHLEAQWTQSRA